jgi:hypothetical protein
VFPIVQSICIHARAPLLLLIFIFVMSDLGQTGTNKRTNDKGVRQQNSRPES